LTNDGGGSERFNHELLFSCSFHESSRYTLHENAHTDPHQQTGGDACASILDLCENIPKIVISVKSCTLKPSGGLNENRFSLAYWYIIQQKKTGLWSILN
jgi:hypothetical protein